MISADMAAHLASGATTLCRAWTVTRRDGQTFGFTDHDRDLVLDGVLHRAGTGLSARALQQSTGLSVDNTEAVGALSDSAISATDLDAGRFDSAEVRICIVNWADPAMKHDLFRGTFGEITRLGSEFRAELRGLSEALNQPVGWAYTRTCSAVLGDSRCRFDTSQPGYQAECTIAQIDEERSVLHLDPLSGFDERWFEFGKIEMLSGAGTGLSGLVKADRLIGGTRVIELWQGLRAAVAAGDAARLTAGCDKRAETCRTRFANLLNFRGFPQMPGEDWLKAYPRTGTPATGGSLILRST